MQIDDKLIGEIIKNIPDPAMRENYKNIISGDYPIHVFCIDPQKKGSKLAHESGVLIGFIDRNGRAIDNPKFSKAGDPVSGIETSRDRFDGRKGFRCYCGNWSIQCEQEKNILKQSRFPIPPTKKEIGDIFTAIKSTNAPTGMQFADGILEYDGFRLEQVNR